jgi:hypothetical protein
LRFIGCASLSAKTLGEKHRFINRHKLVKILVKENKSIGGECAVKVVGRQLGRVEPTCRCPDGRSELPFLVNHQMHLSVVCLG